MQAPLKNPKNNYKQYEKLPSLLHFLDTISNLLASVTGVCASGVCVCFVLAIKLMFESLPYLT